MAAATIPLLGLLSPIAVSNATVTALERQLTPVPSVQPLPFRMDASNQAAWWKPIDELGGNLYVAYDAWGGSSAATGGYVDTHTVYIARRTPNGAWTRDCLRYIFVCAVFRDDRGHRQPSIAIDGDGYIHAFVAMHKNHWAYYRSAAPGDVTTMVNRSTQMPDQSDVYTYPVVTRAGGDVYLMIRAATGAGPEHGRLYRWDNRTNSWSRVAIFALQSGFTVYPDDIVADSAGNVHLIWEWTYGHPPKGPRHYGSYLRYSPASRTFTNAAGAVVSVPVPTASAAVYKPIESGESPTGVDTPATPSPPGMVTAKLALDPATNRPVIAYRYRAVVGGRWQIRIASWTGSGWQRGTVYAGAYSLYATEDVSIHDGVVRAYYVKIGTRRHDQAFAATKQPDGRWVETNLLPGVPVERLAVIGSPTTDQLYLAAPSARKLYVGTLAW